MLYPEKKICTVYQLPSQQWRIIYQDQKCIRVNIITIFENKQFFKYVICPLARKLRATTVK